MKPHVESKHENNAKFEWNNNMGTKLCRKTRIDEMVMEMVV